MNIQHSSGRILTTHVGSLARPRHLLDLMKAKASLSAYDHNAYEEAIRVAVIACVRKQAEAGIDIVTDGEQSKIGFAAYVRERIDGFEARPLERAEWFAAEQALEQDARPQAPARHRSGTRTGC